LDEHVANLLFVIMTHSLKLGTKGIDRGLQLPDLLASFGYCPLNPLLFRNVRLFQFVPQRTDGVAELSNFVVLQSRCELFPLSLSDLGLFKGVPQRLDGRTQLTDFFIRAFQRVL